MEEKLTVYIAEIDAQWEEIQKIYSSIEKKSGFLREDLGNEDLTNSLAYKIHNLYSAYEDLFKLTAHFFENQINDFSGYHVSLLKRMKIVIEGMRPRFLSDESFAILDELRGFRHVFRHAYGYALDAERVLLTAKKSLQLEELFLKDFIQFREKLKKAT
ncbi:MAG: ribonuclease toxin HepT-like protein [Candidatus Loosdrechtia sp.]|uniref:ribonuclease toxin HepT-like protein n=1 Tax=Candidatus Loosdrechtia sp. TaxID=3101272 RepID=UPI003A754D56|nr:MAG: hypothetical protein QY305_05350 [Candidatus Jettenia sp. AMX2]